MRHVSMRRLVGRLLRLTSAPSRAARLAALAAIPLGVQVLAAGAASPAYAATPAAVDTATALQKAYAAARHIPSSAIGTIRPGSLQTGAASGVNWATADFVPSASASSMAQTTFQDGASSAVFRQTNGGVWRLVETGPHGCGRGLPAALVQLWGLAQPASCHDTAAVARSSAARALATAAQPATIGQRIANIALSQVGVGVTPVETSFNYVDCDPYSTLVGAQSPNADGCGYNTNLGIENQDEAWCSDFAKWVWQQAGVTTGMGIINAGSVTFYDWGLAQNEPMPIDAGTPAPGDAVVFFPPGTGRGYADHVGIITSVNSDGTVNMANGDFLGSTNITVQYNTNLSLTTWASGIWHQGEQWVLVTPPTGPQPPNPVAAIEGPHQAVAGTAINFEAVSSSAASSTTYQWTFGDGRVTNASGTQVSHVYAQDGIYPVTVTATSAAGTVTTRAQNVKVVGGSSTVVDAMNPVIWYNPGPDFQYLFLHSGAGLATDIWDGASWLQNAIPGQLDSGSGLTALSYPDTRASDAMTPHAYYSSGGTLAETYLGSSGWTTGTLTGQPAPGSAIVATTSPGGAVSTNAAEPAAFYFNSSGQLAESYVKNGSWVTATVPDAHTTSPGSLAIADSVTGDGTAVRLFYLSGGTLMAATSYGSGWMVNSVASDVAAHSPLSAVSLGFDQARVFFVDEKGRLAAATRGSDGWAVQTLPGAPTSATSLAATSYLQPSGPLGQEVYYLTSAGPAVTYWNGAQWQAQALPGTATGILAADSYQWAGVPQRLFLANGGLSSVDGATAPAGPWANASLPSSPATFADSVLLYAATPDDYTAALNAAAAAGLPASQVTMSFATAWAATLSGNYLVISVGLAATDGLFFNVCGWANPSGDDPGTTPFFYVTGPVNQLLGVSLFEEGAAADASQTPQLATDLAYYATHGALPPGVTSLPAPANPVYACSGQPS